MEDKKQELLPCPFCGGMDIKFTYNESAGHGDRGYTHARYVCKNKLCRATSGLHNYGHVNAAVKIAAAMAWNRRVV